MGQSGLSRLSNEKNPGKCPAREKHTLTFSRKIDKITTYREAVRLRGFPAGSGPSPIARRLPHQTTKLGGIHFEGLGSLDYC